MFERLQNRRAAPAMAAPEPSAAPSAAREKGPVVLQESFDTAATEKQASAEDAANAAAEARDPEAWIAELLTLRAEGRMDELDAGLKAFRAAWPDHPLPPELQGD